ncbi:MAG: glycogen synthase GlgA [Armatimonadota bacterium]
MRVLFVSNEVAPFAKVGGLADVAGSLPRALAGLGVDVRVLMPLHRQCPRDERCEVATEALRVHGPHETITASVLQAELDGSGVPVYLVRHDPFFDRPEVYGPGGRDYPDSPQRYAFLARAALALPAALGWQPDVMHAHDWPTGLLPAFEALSPTGRPTVYTIHNLAYQGQFPPEVAPEIGIDPASEAMRLVELAGKVNFMAAAIRTAAVITTVSERYAQEIQTPAFGERLDGLLRQRSADLYGILNGIDYAQWNPARDPALPAHFSRGAMAGKQVCKAALQREMGLAVTPDVPLMGAVTRLAWQKGLDILAEVLPAALELPVQFVLLGTGEAELEARYRALAAAHPGRVAVAIRHDEAIARRIYAGSDLFIMPSRYEPCGLGQMIAMAYGTVPVVHATGGLADTVVEASEQQTGFVMHSLEPDDVLFAIERAVLAMRDRARWERLVARCMAQDFSWAESARKYADLYERAAASR